ncbi:gliding motility-associated C-terminal domain-containing protein [Fluviicola taffensis]|uniref:PKD domain containing protein n=1 Tax=Fluviicola taffensis (strain DSM 16823 / NCIMB 13979 / RW262) TaxID=755732 RepID=F2IA76_FLUTR|nr:gliding motility-associated C-terminal domain-containing protein [Fluviicola taffensis]AEA45253.1 PKD domain containing protein [Fluviicola taffensis DSM 16823]
MKSLLLFILLLLTSNFGFSQKAKNGAFTITAPLTVVNTYAQVTANVAIGSTTFPVSNTLSLTQGDLILIIQMQGASVDIDTISASPWGWGWGGTYTMSSNSFQALNGLIPGVWTDYRSEFGAVTNYNNAGKHELAEVLSVAGSNVTVRCGLKNNYTATGHVQIVKVPRYSSLTLNANTSIVPQAWNGTTGGIVALEVEGAISFGNLSKISASGFGFRGGLVENVSGSASSANEVGYPGHKINVAGTGGVGGAEKGEGIGGSATAEYTTLYSRYGNGAIANGAGGGNNKNAGGGGGSNVGNTAGYTGKGIPVPGYTAIWDLEAPGMGTSSSPGGGRGGYTGTTKAASIPAWDPDETTVGPNNATWVGDFRRNEGGLGGHPLAYDATRVFCGGGGGAGEMDNSDGGSGGAGGGIVFLQSYGNITGTALIEANGANGQKSNPTDAPHGGARRGVDGAGGAGGGGAIVISNGTALPGTLTLSAIGGNGGNNAIISSSTNNPREADGPGGGGGGGMIAFTSGTPVQNVGGGNSGIVVTTNLTNVVANFPPNGATNGATGTSSLPQTYYNLTANNATICTGGTANLSVSVQGTLPAPVTNANITWYATYTSTAALGTGLTFTTPVLAATTTYYVGFCPGGTFRIPVTVTVGGPTISGTAVVSNATCSTGGSITGLTTSGGAPTPVITWNSVVNPTMNLTNASAGSYTVTVTDGVGCTATSGPYVIGTSGGPTINSTNMVVTNASCTGGGGSISGITATGTGLTYNWNTGAYSSLDITNINSGNYSLLVTDNNGCTATLGPINVGQNAGPTINTTNMVFANTTCGLSNGSITGISATGTGLTYNWNTGAYSTLDITGLASGNYNLVVTDNIGCTASVGPIVIGASSAPVINSASIAITHAHCGQSTGAISGLTVSGGQTAYTYSWNSGAYSTLNLSAIPAGNYSLQVTDNLGCIVNAGPFTVNDIAGPTINSTNVVITNETCAGNDGAITGITASGAGTLTYTWNLVPSAGLNHTNIPGGTYGLIVSDAFGCNAVAGPFNVGLSPGPAINTTNMVVTNTTCGLSNGSITGINATGTGLTYQWNGVGSTLNQSNLASGNYTLIVTDANNCTTTYGPISIGASNSLTLNTTNVQITHETCALNDGTISGLIANGTGTLTYTWNGGVSPTLNQTGLSPGVYNVVVSDVFGCSVNGGPFTVNAVIPLSLNQNSLLITPTGCTGNIGAIHGLQIVGGINPTVSWSPNGQTTLSIGALAAGNYTITVTDDQNCSIQETFTVPTTSGLAVNTNNVVITNDNCGTGTGTISGVTVSGGTNPYSYSWNNSSTLNTLDISNLTTGNYVLVVTDNAGCQATTTLFVGVVPASVIDQTNVLVSNESCIGNNGSINGIQIAGNGPYSYSWTGTPLTSLNLTNLTAGVYTLTITDVNGCTTTGLPITVSSGPMPNANFTISPVIASPGELINFTDASSGGVIVDYSWNISGVGSISTSSSCTYNSMIEGDYHMTLVIETADGCIDSITKGFQILGELKIPNIVTANGDHTNDEFYITNLKPNSKLIIQNRWGNLVFESANYKNDWGGKDLEGNKIDDGVYFYQLITADGKIWQGNVHLLID